MLSFVRERDTVVVQSLDRLGRNSKDIKELLQLIRSKRSNIEILDLPSFQGVTDPALKDLLTNLVIEVVSNKESGLPKKMAVLRGVRFNMDPILLGRIK